MTLATISLAVEREERRNKVASTRVEVSALKLFRGSPSSFSSRGAVSLTRREDFQGRAQAMVAEAEMEAAADSQGVVVAPEVQIPKIIHHSWKEDLSAASAPFPQLSFKTSYESWKRFFPTPEYKYMFHTNSDLDHCLQQEFPGMDHLQGELDA